MSNYIDNFPKPFLEDIVNGRCLPFVGAGFSLNAKVPRGKKMPDWDTLGKLAASKLLEYQYTTAIEALSAYSHEYSRVKLIEFLSSALLITTIQPAKPHEEFCRLPCERVVTTNFDFLLETAYSRITKYCIPIVSEDQLAVTEMQAGVRLLKLHGDLHHPNRLIVTEEDYDSYLSNFPLLATHLSSLLIDHTALFIGYSLDDPDYRQIWQVVKKRLGVLRRPAYVLQIGALPHTVARYERRGVKVINLPKSTTHSYGETLEIVFRELLDYWLSKVTSLSITTEPESQAELSLPSTAQSRLAFFSVPTRYAAFYKTNVYPIAERFGFSPIMAADVIAPGDNIMAKVYALIEKSALVLADTTSPNTMFEIGMVLSRAGLSKALILIAEDKSSLPYAAAEYRIVLRPKSLDENIGVFIQSIEKAFSIESSKISTALIGEPNRLLSLREYRAAVLSAFSLLEHNLRQYVEPMRQDVFLSRQPMRSLLEIAQSQELISEKEISQIRDYIVVRNRIAHSSTVVTANQAKEIVKFITRIVSNLGLSLTENPRRKSRGK